MYKIDAIDQQIISMLQENAKVSINEMSEKLGLTKTPIYERIKKLEEQGIIENYVAIINHKKLNGGMLIFCSVSLDGQKLPEIEEFKSKIMEIPEVMECYLMGGENDFLLKVMVDNLEAYHQFASGKLATIKNVNQIKSTFVLDVIKKTSPVTV